MVPIVVNLTNTNSIYFAVFSPGRIPIFIILAFCDNDNIKSLDEFVDNFEKSKKKKKKNLNMQVLLEDLSISWAIPTEKAEYLELLKKTMDNTMVSLKCFGPRALVFLSALKLLMNWEALTIISLHIWKKSTCVGGHIT